MALLMANVSQLKVLMETTKMSGQVIAVIVLVAISMLLQLVVGIMLIYVGIYERDDSIRSPDPKPDAEPMMRTITNREAANEEFEDLKKAGRIHDRLTNLVNVGIFIILFINIIVSGMGLGMPTGKDTEYNIEHLGLNTSKSGAS